MIFLRVNIHTGIGGSRSLRHRNLHRRFLGLLLTVGILVRHLQFGIIFAGRIRSESESDGTRSAGRHIADILRGLRGGDAVTLDGRFDIGYIPLALVHVFHGNGGFLARIDGVWKHGIAQFETVGLRNRYGNLDIRSVGIAGAAIDILVFEVDIDALRAVLRTRQHLHGHGLGQGIARPQRIVVERVRTAGNGEILAAVNGHDHIADRDLAHILEGEAKIEIRADRHGTVAIGEVGDDDVRHRTGRLHGGAAVVVVSAITVFGERRRHNAGQRDGDGRHQCDEHVDEFCGMVAVTHGISFSSLPSRVVHQTVIDDASVK